MKTNNYLVVVNDLDILKLKVNGLNFLFPIKNYAVGFTETFEINDIKADNAYIYINRILDKETISKLYEDLKNLPKNIIGICFTDLALIEIVKELNLDLKLIYMQTHNTTNYKSINYYLEYVDSVLVSTDITKEEIDKILANAIKPLVVPYFMLADVMYSRRTLLTNYQDNFGLDKNNKVELKENVSNNDFLALENEYGTMIYQQKYVDYRGVFTNNILYYFVNPLGLEINDIKKIFNNEDLSLISDTGFLNKKTYYRLK